MEAQRSAMSVFNYSNHSQRIIAYRQPKVIIYTPTQQGCWGWGWGDYIGFRPSVRLSVRPASCVRSVASAVQDGFFPYLVQMISSMKGCVACDDLWHICSRSFGFDLENRVRSVGSTVLDGFFLYLTQIITIIRRCVGCYGFFFQNLDIWIFGKLLKFFGLWPRKKIFSSRWILSIFSTNDH